MLIIDSVDIHPKRHISFASRWNHTPFSRNPLNPGNPSDLLWPDHSIGETDDVKLIDGIIDPANCVKVYKGWMRNRDAYSAFDMGLTEIQGNAEDGYEAAVGAKTLLEVLQMANVKTLRVLGLITPVCVKQNVLDALRYGFDVELAEEGIRSLDVASHRAAMDDMLALNDKPNAQGRIQSVKVVR